MTPSPGDAAEYRARATAGDARAGVRLALDLLARGVPFDDLVQMLADVQRDVGRRWADAEWSVADEHLVSGVSQRVLDALAAEVELPPPVGRGVVACAEGEWHALPAQMLAERLAVRGFSVAFLGGSTPPEHVASFMARVPADFLAVSCSVALHYPGVAALVAAGHAAGVPVIAGGRALDAARAERLGADGWAEGPDDAAEVLRRWIQEGSPRTPGRPPVTLDQTALALDRAAPAHAEAALDLLSARVPVVAGWSARRVARAREGLEHLVRFVAAALLVQDATVLEEVIGWLRPLLAVRGVPDGVVDGGLLAVHDVLAGRVPAGAELLARYLVVPPRQGMMLR